MHISDRAVEATARALWIRDATSHYSTGGAHASLSAWEAAAASDWDERHMASNVRAVYMKYAHNALKPAAPHIAAQALRDVADSQEGWGQWIHDLARDFDGNPFPCLVSTDELRRGADALEQQG